MRRDKFKKSLAGLRLFFHRLRKEGIPYIGFWIGVAMVLMALVAPFVSPYDPLVMISEEKLLPPSYEHPFGTDDLGRDVATRTLWGARISLLVATIALSIALLIGVPLGLISGYFGRYVDEIIMRGTDIMLAFPDILLALLIITIIGRGVTNVAIAVGISWAPHYARLMRGSVMSIKNKEYVEAARAIGDTPLSIMGRVILPNSIAPVVVMATMTISHGILAEAALSFLGLGTMPPDPSWGLMMSTGRLFLRTAPWIAIFPGIFCAVTVLGFALFGDGLNDVLNPRLRHEA
jgi:ABC-type dipeptide/oligopeptide/nickel transport system permease subunit